MLSLQSVLIASFLVFVIFSYLSILLSLISHGCKSNILMWTTVLFQIIITRPFTMPFSLTESRRNSIDKYLKILRLSKRKHRAALNRLMKSKKLLIYFVAYSMMSSFINFDRIYEYVIREIALHQSEALKTKMARNKLYFKKVSQSFITNNGVNVLNLRPKWKLIIEENLFKYSNSKKLQKVY